MLLFSLQKFLVFEASEWNTSERIRDVFSGNKMKGIFVLICVAVIAVAAVDNSDPAYGDDNDFAEFEDFDADDDFVQATTPKQSSDSPKRTDQAKQNADRAADDSNGNDDFAEAYENDDGDDGDGIVEEEDSEFDHFNDEEEFEGFKAEPAPPNVDQTTGEPKLTMANVPLHFRCVCSCLDCSQTE